MTITQIKENLIGLSHSGSLNKVRNFEALLERVGNTVLAKIDPLETQRTIPLTQVIHDTLYNYPLPADFNKLIDLYPEDARTILDEATRDYAENFARRVNVGQKEISIEGSEGSKFMRVNWKSRQPKTMNTMDSLTANGAWSVVGSATGLVVDTLYKLSGSGSIKFNVVATGDGIKNTTQSVLDLTTWNQLADVIFPVYLEAITNITSITPIFGNDLTANYWTCVAQTAQADGTAFRIGWNYIKAKWSLATQTGTVAPATIDSFKVTFQTTGAINNVRVDAIIFSLGRNFDIKYYSKYLIKTTAGVFQSRTTSDDDVVVLDNDAIQIFLMEALRAIAQQIEGEDSSFDIGYAEKELYGNPSAPDVFGRLGLYRRYQMEHPGESKKALTRWSSGPRFRQ